jgi:hypothetical protein
MVDSSRVRARQYPTRSVPEWRLSDAEAAPTFRASRRWRTLRAVAGKQARKPRSPVAARLAAVDWVAAQDALDEVGHVRLPRLLSAAECRTLAQLYPRDERFRSTVNMAQHRFGRGEYRYFTRPLPPLVEALRRALYPPLARVANRWQERLRAPDRYERSLAGFLGRCRAAGQERPTPLLLRYEREGFNCLHQDLYGSVAFPLQVTILLSRPERDFSGGEFLLVEQRPRQQSRGEAVSLCQGEAIIFPTRERPVEGTRGVYRAQLRHGVSRLIEGERLALGIIFHDAR